MVEFGKKVLKRVKLILLYWTRIVFVKNDFKSSFFTKIKANLGGGFLADQYILYDFKHNNKNEYLSEFDWYRSRYINEPFDVALNNKVICTEILKHHIRFAENYFIKNKNNVLDFKNGVRTHEDIYNCLVEHGRLVIKPFALGKGNGVHLFSFEEGRVYIDDKPHTKEEFIEFITRRDGYIICEYMKQHEYSDQIYDKTVNTIRFITMRDINTHNFKVFFAVQRIGTKKTIPVDNGSKGGLVAKIDLETGMLSEAKCLKNLNVYEVHPDSGKAIKGVVIPRWQEIKKEVLDVANKMPYMDFIAWDLLITEEGVCVIEANTSSGVNIIQLWGGQRNGELGDFFRHYNVIK